MKTFALLAALTVVAAPAFAGDHAKHAVEKVTKTVEVSGTVVSATVVSTTAAVSATVAAE